MSFAQGRIYTKKLLLADFPTKTIKIAVDENSTLGRSLSDEISARWRISPFEFCTLAEVESFTKDNNFYLLRFAEENGILYLKLDKGGKDDDPDKLKRPVDVVQAPFCPAQSNGQEERAYLGALVDIIQTFVDKALETESIAYKGLDAFHSSKIQDLKLYFNCDYSDSFANNEYMSAVALCVASSTEALSYKMIITTDTHELLYFKRLKSSINLWSTSDINFFAKKNEVISQ